MKNTDIKLLASAANRSLHTLAAGTAHEQQGFVNGRQLLRNVAVVDTEARRLSVQPSAENDQPIFISLDIAAAFPSIGHQWLWIVLSRWGISGRMLKFLRACYYMPLSFLELNG
eukprot:9481509-Pyramimonas_sp.AAC.1